MGAVPLVAQLPASHTAERALQIREGQANGGIWAVICMMGRMQLLNLLTGEREEIPGEANSHTIFAACHGGAGRERTAKEVFAFKANSPGF